MLLKRPSANRSRLALVAVLWLLLGTLGGLGFRTVDPRGFERVRSIVHVWSAVPPRLPQADPAWLVLAAYTAALVLIVVGGFVLLWYAVAGDDEAAPRPVAPAVRQRVAALLACDARTYPRPAVAIATASALIVFVAWQLHAFAPMRSIGVADSFASIDHPFHVGRAQVLLDSLRNGENLRWVANHQGGYPVEFYPFGFAWFEVVLWAAALGRVAMPVIHKWAVIALFLAPALAFHAMARRDRFPATVALAALVLHVAVPGAPFQGGYSELVFMGLVANVSAAVCTLAAMVAAADAFETGRGRALGGAALAAAAAIWCNPRSAIGLAVCLFAAWVVAMARRGSFRRTATVLATIAVLSAAMAAPQLVSLLRFRDLYHFVRFTDYASPLAFAAATMDAVSVPAFSLAVVGTVTALLAFRRQYVAATAALALCVYVATTLGLAFGASTLVPQLEATRLMPLQRLLMVYLAAAGLHVVGRLVAERLARHALAPAIEAGVIAAALFVFLGPDRLLPFWSRGLYEVDRSTVPEMATFQQALDIAHRTVPPEHAILVVGTAVSTHQQLWAPVRIPDRRFFYDDWMWYWHTRHRGPYDARRATRYDWRRLDEVYSSEFLQMHGIGGILVFRQDPPPVPPENSADDAQDPVPDPQALADRARTITRVFGGDVAFYAVTHATGLVDLPGAPSTSLRTGNHHIEAAGVGTGGEALVRHNWFPRWRATVNDQPAAIARGADGYMRVRVPPGPVRVTLTYVRERIDVVTAAVAATAFASTMILVVWPCTPSRPRQSP